MQAQSIGLSRNDFLKAHLWSLSEMRVYLHAPLIRDMF